MVLRLIDAAMKTMFGCLIEDQGVFGGVSDETDAQVTTTMTVRKVKMYD
jgi:hypothetical protein